MRNSARATLRTAVVGTASTAAVGTVTAAVAWFEAHHPHTLERTILRDDAVPAPERSSLKILHLSDTHFLAHHRRRAEYVRRLASYEPDLVVCTGDLIGAASALGVCMSALEPLLKFPGVIVTGSNDYFAAELKNPARYLWKTSANESEVRKQSLPTDELIGYLVDGGWIDLRNTTARIEVREWTLEFLGVDDPHIRLDSWPESWPVGEGVGRRHLLRVGMAHAPYQHVLDKFRELGCDLVFSGHTHGGQVCVPFIGKALTTNCDLPTKYASGSFFWPACGNGDDPVYRGSGDAIVLEPGQMLVNVSRGVGAAPFAPFRLGCRPSAELFEVFA